MAIIVLKILIKALIPLLYCLIVGGACSQVLHRSFLVSIAPAFFVQIIIMMITGMAFHSVFLGAGILTVLSAVIVTLKIIYNPEIHSINDRSSMKTAIGRIYPMGELIAFIAVYLAVWILNYDKYLSFWDEFSHWGMFVKETFRLDDLFCCSPLDIPHKDYLPASTLFEAWWCKMMLGCSDDNMYRGIQILQLSTILPAVYYSTNDSKIKGDLAHKGRIKKFVSMFWRGLLLLSIPIILPEPFYHTIIADLILGVLIFYSMWIIITQPDDWSTVIILLLTLCVLSTVKVTAIPFVPMIIVFYLVYNKKLGLIQVGRCLLLLSVPVILWKSVNTFTFRMLEKVDSDLFLGQSYKNVSINKAWSYLFHTRGDDIQLKFDKIYFDGLLKRPLVGDMSYIVAIIFMTVILIVASCTIISDLEIRRQFRLISLWIILAGFAYAVLMYLAYMMTFDHEYALGLPSFDRYMSSFVIAVYLLGPSALLNNCRIDGYKNSVMLICELIIIITAVRYNRIDQLFPGNMSLGNLGYVAADELRCTYDFMLIDYGVQKGDSVYIVTRGNTTEDITYIAYYVHPTVCTGASPGPDLDELDTHSWNMTINEFVDEVSESEYLYLRYIDDAFIRQYEGAFVHPETIQEYSIYKISTVDGRIDNTLVYR